DSICAGGWPDVLTKSGRGAAAMGGQGGLGGAAPAARAGFGSARDGGFLRPRPAIGMFTSLLVTSGETRRLADHVARLNASARQLFGKGLPSALPDSLVAKLSQSPAGRLRLSMQPAGGQRRAVVEVVPLDQPPAQVTLRLAVIEGGLGAHKWLDRRLLADLSRSMALQPGEQLLIEDADGDVLETDRANIFAVIGGMLHTPPPDGRLPPGVAKGAGLPRRTPAGHGARLTPPTTNT